MDLFEWYSSAKTPVSNCFEVGALVEARFGSGDEYFPGTVVAAHADGSYAVDYDDGDQELNVSVDLIRSLQSAESAERLVEAGIETEDCVPQVTA